MGNESYGRTSNIFNEGRSGFVQSKGAKELGYYLNRHVEGLCIVNHRNIEEEKPNYTTRTGICPKDLTKCVRKEKTLLKSSSNLGWRWKSFTGLGVSLKRVFKTYEFSSMILAAWMETSKPYFLSRLICFRIRIELLWGGN